MDTNEPTRVKYLQNLQVIFLVVFFVSFLIPCYKGSSFSFCCSKSEVYYGYKCFISSFVLGIMSFRQNPLVSVLILASGLWVPVMLLIRKNKKLLYALTVPAIISLSVYWILSLTRSLDEELMTGYWIWYGSSIGIIFCRILISVYKN